VERVKSIFAEESVVEKFGVILQRRVMSGLQQGFPGLS